MEIVSRRLYEAVNLNSSAGLVLLAYSESAALVAVTRQSVAWVADTVVGVG